MATCLNCATVYDGNFCPSCGQKHDTHRITLGTILHDIPHSVFHIDKGFLYTFRVLTYRPGNAIREYIEGKRVNFFSPFAYLILLSTISSFIAHSTAEFRVPDPHHGGSMLFPALAEFLNHYPALTFALMAPFISFTSWLFKRRDGYNYFEHLVLNIYLIAQFNLFYIISYIAHAITRTALGQVTPIIIFFMGYVTFAYLQFFPRRPGMLFILSNTVMFFAIALVLITGLSVTGIMTPWWNF